MADALQPGPGGPDAPTRTVRLRPPQAPRRIGPCSVLKELGRGGMGSVHEAELVVDRPYGAAGTRVALKILHHDLGWDASATERFRREAELGCAIDHPAVVRTYEAGADATDGLRRHYMVLELVVGETLRQLLLRLRTLPEALVRDVGAQVADGLAAVHAAGAVHRDLKPSNVLITPDHRVRVMDLGIARRMAANADLTVPGGFVGTPRYAAPEQLLGGAISPATDLFSLGVVLFECASGACPFPAEDESQALRMHVEGEPPSLLDASPEATPFLAEVTASLLERDPTRRLGDAARLAEILRQGEQSEWWRTREVTAATGTRGALRSLRVARETAFVGREADLAALRESADSARRGRGAVVVLEGEAGVGKSRLVAELLDEMKADDAVDVLYGAAHPGGSGHRDPFASALLARFGHAHLARALRSLLPRTPRLAPAFAAYLAGEDAAAAERLPAEAIDELYLQVLEGLAAERTVAWVVEDLHFASPRAQAVLAALASRIAELPALLVATTRPGLPAEVTAELARSGVARHRTLDRLDAAAVTALVADALDSDSLAAALAPALVARSDGNPLFVLAFVDEMKSRHVLQQTAEGRWSAGRDLAAIAVPATVSDVVKGRLGALEREERDLLEVAAVLGFEFDPGLVAAVLGRERLQVLQALAVLERRTAVVRGQGARFRFDHHLLQEIVLASLPQALRSEYHARIAESYERLAGLEGRAADDVPGEAATFLAGHFVRSGRPQRAAALLLAAFDHLARQGRPDAILELAAAAERGDGDSTGIGAAAWASFLASAPPRFRARWHADLGEASWRQGRLDGARAHLEQALRMVGRKPARRGRAAAAQLLGQALVQALHLALPAALLRSRGARRELMREGARAAAVLAHLGIYKSDAVGILHSSLLAVNLGERAGEPDVLALGMLGFAASGLGSRRLARRYFERARREAVARDDQRGLCDLTLLEAVHWFGAGEVGAATSLSEENVDRARRIGYRVGAFQTLGLRGVIRLTTGRLDEALEAFREQLDEGQGLRLGTLAAYPYLGLAQPLLEMGRLSEAEEALAAAAELMGDEPRFRHVVLGLRALAAARRGDFDAARTHAVSMAREAEGTVRAVPVTDTLHFAAPAEALLRCRQAAVELGADDPGLAREAASAVRLAWRWARPHAIRRPRARLLVGRAAWMDGRTSEAVEAWTRARAEAARLGLVRDHGRALLELARAAAPGSEERHRLAAEARTHLVAAGARPDLDELDPIERAGG